MLKGTKWGVIVATAVLVLPGATAAQQTLADMQVADLETMKDKFHQLAEAFPADTWDWRPPMEGVRSVKDVLALMVAEGNIFPTLWGYDAPEGWGGGFGAVIQKAGAMSNAELLEAMDAAFDHIISVVRGMDREARAKEVTVFGTDTTVRVAITTASSDMHEHLGQLIAYARTNHIVPPWSG